MKTVIRKLAAGPLRYAVRQVLQRPWLKKKIRDMVTHMPGLHRLAMRLMFQAPAAGQAKLSGDLKDLSPEALRIHRALKGAMRTRRK
jgi:hypothetical protein